MAKPEDTPMKKQWLEVDGRMTPVILPQIWNHDKEEWEVTSEQSPLPTRVTGSNVVLLKKHESTTIADNDPGRGNRWLYYGDNETASPVGLRALDVSEFSRVSIYIENNYNGPLTSVIVYGFKENNIKGRDGNLLYEFQVDTLEPGESIYITEEEFIDFRRPSPGIGVRFMGNAADITEGFSEVIFYGERV